MARTSTRRVAASGKVIGGNCRGWGMGAYCKHYRRAVRRYGDELARRFRLNPHAADDMVVHGNRTVDVGSSWKIETHGW